MQKHHFVSTQANNLKLCSTPSPTKIPANAHDVNPLRNNTRRCLYFVYLLVSILFVSYFWEIHKLKDMVHLKHPKNKWSLRKKFLNPVSDVHRSLTAGLWRVEGQCRSRPLKVRRSSSKRSHIKPSRSSPAMCPPIRDATVTPPSDQKWNNRPDASENFFRWSNIIRPASIQSHWLPGGGGSANGDFRDH